METTSVQKVDEVHPDHCISTFERESLRNLTTYPCRLSYLNLYSSTVFIVSALKTLKTII